jgi:galactose mutarotase-like enzyme
MPKQIISTTWYGQSAWALESEALRAVILPERGAKIASLYDKRAGREWLAHPAPPFQPLTYGESFIDQDMSGWDEMFPTIIACPYPGAGPYRGQALPDHGEVWALPWQVERAANGELLLSVQGRALPYRLWRMAKLVEAATLELSYRLENLGAANFNYLWAAHPQFVADASTAICLPKSNRSVINVMNSALWGEAGRQYPWPLATTSDGTHWQLDRIAPAERGDCRKFYLPPDEPATWAALADERTGSTLHIEWSPAQVPYLGIWVDEGAYSREAVTALEPSSGFYDSLAWACENHRAPSIASGESHAWTLSVGIR